MNDAARRQAGPQCRDRDPVRAAQSGALRVGGLDVAAQNVVPADEARDEGGLGPIEYGARRRCLLDATLIHHDNEIGESQRLVLAVGHVDEADAELPLEALQLLAHAHAQERVECGKRLVEQQHARIGDERARERHALLLPAGQLRREPLRLGLHLDKAQHLTRLGATLDLRHTAHAQAERDVVDAVEMREERVALKHHRGAPSLLAADRSRARRRR